MSLNKTNFHSWRLFESIIADLCNFRLSGVLKIAEILNISEMYKLPFTLEDACLSPECYISATPLHDLDDLDIADVFFLHDDQDEMQLPADVPDVPDVIHIIQMSDVDVGEMLTMLKTKSDKLNKKWMGDNIQFFRMKFSNAA